MSSLSWLVVAVVVIIILIVVLALVLRFGVVGDKITEIKMKGKKGK